MVGAGVSGLATAAFLPNRDYLVLEAEQEPGGYCRTVVKDGFVWDYSGHFFHFKNAEMEAWLRARMGTQKVHTIQKKSVIRYADRDIDFPFQKNIHQLPHAEFLECLHDVFMAGHQKQPEDGSFKGMLYARLGRGISEKFLIPYNEKLYATDLQHLDRDAMGRFFPHADVADIIRNMRTPDNGGYNATFTYPEGGAIQYVHALMSAVDPKRVLLGQRVVAVDLARRTVQTSTGQTIRYTNLVSSAPLPSLLRMCGLPHNTAAFTWNKVLVFNLGFDRPGPTGVHWMYFPQKDLSFYRVGFYNNIFGSPRLSLYVELGYPKDAQPDVAAMQRAVVADLQRAGVTTTEHQLVASHHVMLDPAYVHITRDSLAETARVQRILRTHGVFSIGRYGAWTYCSIEDNMLEARALAQDLCAV